MHTKFLVGALVLVATLGGCSTARIAAPENQIASIRATLDAWRQGVQEKDIDAVMPLISNEFTSGRLGNKRDYKKTLSKYFADGMLDGATIDVERAHVSIEDRVATAYPVAVKSASGAYTLGFFLREEEGQVWRIIGMDMSPAR